MTKSRIVKAIARALRLMVASPKMTKDEVGRALGVKVAGPKITKGDVVRALGLGVVKDEVNRWEEVPYPLTRAALEAYYNRGWVTNHERLDLDFNVREAYYFDTGLPRNKCLSMSLTQVEVAIGYEHAQAYKRTQS